MIDHTGTRVTLTLNGREHEFGKLVPKDLLDVIQWANDRERARALEMIPTATVEERIKVFRETGNRYDTYDLAEALSDISVIVECLYRCYVKANPDATRDQFAEIFGLLDLPMLESIFNLVSGMVESGDTSDPNSTGQVEAPAPVDSAGSP